MMILHSLNYYNIKKEELKTKNFLFLIFIFIFLKHILNQTKQSLYKQEKPITIEAVFSKLNPTEHINKYQYSLQALKEDLLKLKTDIDSLEIEIEMKNKIKNSLLSYTENYLLTIDQDMQIGIQTIKNNIQNNKNNNIDQFINTNYELHIEEMLKEAELMITEIKKMSKKEMMLNMANPLQGNEQNKNQQQAQNNFNANKAKEQQIQKEAEIKKKKEQRVRKKARLKEQRNPEIQIELVTSGYKNLKKGQTQIVSMVQKMISNFKNQLESTFESQKTPEKILEENNKELCSNLQELIKIQEEHKKIMKNYKTQVKKNPFIDENKCIAEGYEKLVEEHEKTLLTILLITLNNNHQNLIKQNLGEHITTLQIQNIQILEERCQKIIEANKENPTPEEEVISLIVQAYKQPVAAAA